MAHLRSNRPVIGITADVAGGAEKFLVGRGYAQMVEAAGGIPVILPPFPNCVEAYLELCAGIILTGGDDPIMTHWNIPMHPKATPMDQQRQTFELALLTALDRRPEKAVLGICLGMQLMGLHAGGRLNQHLPDTLPTADRHWQKQGHEVSGEIGCGIVHSHHRQALSDPGSLQVVATAFDGVIEGVRRGDRPFYLGVQWHPERTDDGQLGFGMIRRLVAAAGGMPLESPSTSNARVRLHD